MKALNLRNRKHPNFVFIEPTEHRINKSVAWRARCKHCGQEQLVGASQVTTGAHALCVYCQKPKELTSRYLPEQPVESPE